MGILKTMKVRRLSSEYLQHLGYRVKILRTLMKMNQGDLASPLQTTASQISKMEQGKATPNLYHLLTIKELADRDQNLGGEISWKWLLHGRGNMFEN